MTQLGASQGKKRDSRHFIAFSVILFLVILVVGSAAFLLSMRQIIRDNKGGELTRILEVERINLEVSVNSRIAIVLKMAESPLIVRYFSNPHDPELEMMALEEIASYRRAIAGSVFWVNDIDKQFYIDDREPYTVNPELPENYWYNMTLYETETYNFNINYNPDLNVINLWINAPIFDKDRKPIGMLGCGVDVSAFVRHQYDVYRERADLYFFNTNGEITGAKDIELVIAKEHIEKALGNTDGILDLARKLKPGETHAFDSPLGKAAVGTVPALEWYSVAVMPDSIDDYKNHVTAVFLVMLAVMALIIVIFNVFIAIFLKSLNRTMDSLENTSRYKSDFLARMSHEIRTPMNAVIGMAELALREAIPRAAYEQIVTIKQSGQTLLAIINDILDFSKIESGKLEILPTNYLFSSLINDVISIIRMRVIDSQVRFAVNIDSNIPNALLGDEIRIRQILLNVLSNAVKYTGKGYVKFNVTGKIDNDENVVNLTMEIVDSGKGIKQEDMNKLFGDFVQVNQSDNTGIEGTGLGLAITRSLVKAMCGDITVSSQYGVGSTFTVMLPQKIREHEKMATVEDPEEKRVLIYEHRAIYADSVVRTVGNLGVQCTLVSSAPVFREEMSGGNYPFVFIAPSLYENVRTACSEFGTESTVVLLTEFGESVADQNLSVLSMPVYPTSVANILNGISGGFSYGETESVIRFTAPEASVLVVDDINTNLKVTEGLLHPYEMQVKLCQSGMDALNAITSKKYDMVFMDHMMPEMDGIETTARIRALNTDDSYFTNIPIIALTANAVSGTKEMFLANGFSDFLSKPIDTIKLNFMLEKWIPKDKQKKIVIENGVDSMMRKRSACPNLTIDGVDVKKGISFAGGTFEEYKQLLAIFFQDGLEKIEQIKTSLETNDLSSYVTPIHALKSAAAYIGADELSEKAKALEAAGKQQDRTFIQTHNPALLSALKALLDAIDVVLGANEKGERKKTADMTLLKAELAKLAAAIDSVNPGAVKDAVKNIQPFTEAADVGDAVAKILQNTLIGEYDEVVAMIKNF